MSGSVCKIARFQIAFLGVESIKTDVHRYSLLVILGGQLLEFSFEEFQVMQTRMDGD